MTSGGTVLDKAAEHSSTALAASNNGDWNQYYKEHLQILALETPTSLLGHPKMDGQEREDKSPHHLNKTRPHVFIM